MGAATHLTALLVIGLLAAALSGALANFVTGSAFPFEGCKQDPFLSLYSATLYSVTSLPGGSVNCFEIHVKDQELCREQNNFPNNSTRCCDVGFNKFKFYPNQACRYAVRSATVKLVSENFTRPAAVTYQMMPVVNQFVMKLTNLQLEPATAQGAIVCVTLTNPCPNLATWAYDGKELEYNLYDAKLNWPYECCPAGILPLNMNGTMPVPPSPMPPSPAPPPNVTE